MPFTQEAIKVIVYLTGSYLMGFMTVGYSLSYYLFLPTDHLPINSWARTKIIILLVMIMVTILSFEVVIKKQTKQV